MIAALKLPSEMLVKVPKSFLSDAPRNPVLGSVCCGHDGARTGACRCGNMHIYYYAMARASVYQSFRLVRIVAVLTLLLLRAGRVTEHTRRMQMKTMQIEEDVTWLSLKRFPP